ncbi:MAG: diphthine synthase [Candidatus Aenigmatarchaeota archaeon]
MLTLVGLGLWDEKDVTLRGVEAAKAADAVYIELYTNAWRGKGALEKIVGKKITELKREDLEQRAAKLVEEAKSKDVVLFVSGDPLVATTHSMILNDAKKAGVGTMIVHNASIVSAIGETGLHVYKFGATATVPFKEKTAGEPPESVYDTIKANKERGLHTLLLLDITPERCMTPNEAMCTLLELEKEREEKVFIDETEIVVLARAGAHDSKITFGRVRELKDSNFGEPPMGLIVPGKMHFSEREYLGQCR